MQTPKRYRNPNQTILAIPPKDLYPPPLKRLVRERLLAQTMAVLAGQDDLDEVLAAMTAALADGTPLEGLAPLLEELIVARATRELLKVTLGTLNLAWTTEPDQLPRRLADRSGELTGEIMSGHVPQVPCPPSPLWAPQLEAYWQLGALQDHEMLVRILAADLLMAWDHLNGHDWRDG